MEPKFSSDIDTLFGLFLLLCMIAYIVLENLLSSWFNKKPIAVNVYVSSPVPFDFFDFILRTQLKAVHLRSAYTFCFVFCSVLLKKNVL